MKCCPQCGREYDNTMMFCLDDGAELLYGPSSSAEASTEILRGGIIPGEAATRTFEPAGVTKDLPATMTASRRLWIGGAVMVVLAAVLGWASYTYYGNRRVGAVESIAVLPFVNVAGNADLEYLSDGLTESLINSLSQVPNLSVKARSSVFSYKGKDVTPRQVADDLAVQAILSGRVQQIGDQIVLNVELVDAATGNHLWGDQYSRQMADLFRLQGEIARDVSNKLRAKLSAPDQQKVAKNYTENTEAYQLYLRGRHHWNKRKPDDIRKSIEYFQQAIDKDPTYALAYAALAEAYILSTNYWLESQHDAYPKARAAAEKAIAIDESLAEAYNAQASVLSNHEWKFAEAEAAWRKAISLNPNYASAHQWYAEFLISMGRHPEALAEMKRAQELDPISLIINGMVGVTLKFNGQPDAALEQLKKTLEMDPNFPRTHLYLGELYESIGRYDDAVDAMERHAVLNGVSPQDAARLAAAVKAAIKADGEKGYSRALAGIMENAQGQGKPPLAVVAALYVHAGDTDKAFGILEQAYRDRDDSILMLKGYRFDAIKTDPRYKDLIRRVGLPE
jgi:TolB-like protein/Tfp pilus assembly protein PilF